MHISSVVRTSVDLNDATYFHVLRDSIDSLGHVDRSPGLLNEQEESTYFQ